VGVGEVWGGVWVGVKRGKRLLKLRGTKEVWGGGGGGEGGA
jgi:hypothetical protein